MQDQAWEAAVMEDGPGGEERSWGRRGNYPLKKQPRPDSVLSALGRE